MVMLLSVTMDYPKQNHTKTPNVSLEKEYYIQKLDFVEKSL